MCGLKARSILVPAGEPLDLLVYSLEALFRVLPRGKSTANPEDKADHRNDTTYQIIFRALKADPNAMKLPCEYLHVAKKPNGAAPHQVLSPLHQVVLRQLRGSFHRSRFGPPARNATRGTQPQPRGGVQQSDSEVLQLCQRRCCGRGLVPGTWRRPRRSHRRTWRWRRRLGLQLGPTRRLRLRRRRLRTGSRLRSVEGRQAIMIQPWEQVVGNNPPHEEMYRQYSTVIDASAHNRPRRK
mmetsp:Transcript_35283/g.88217  ORF Transcript_35283/g.88217 Transcript_35283/m.88217 type:complete len:239 (-) Transcript_35283:315-1031(-)